MRCEPRRRRPRGVGASSSGSSACRSPARSCTPSRRWEEAAGGGAVAAVQLAKLNGVGAPLHRARRRRARPAARAASSRRAASRVHAAAARRAAAPRVHATSTTTASGRSRSSGRSSFPRATTARCRGRSSRAATPSTSSAATSRRSAPRAGPRVLVATARELATLRRAEEELDVLVGSGEDAGERFEPGELEPPPRHRRHDRRARSAAGSRPGGPFRAAPLPGPDRGRLRLRRLLRGRAHLRARARAARWRTRSRLGARCGAAVLPGAGPTPGS